MGRKTRVYLAGPLFTQAEWRWNEFLADELRALDLEVCLPQTGVTPMLKGERKLDARAVFIANTASIDEADVVLAILDQPDPDSGTCWECGYAYKTGRPVVGVRTDMRRAGDDPEVPVNLMLSQSCKEVIQLPLEKRDDVLWVARRAAEAIRRHVDAGR